MFNMNNNRCKTDSRSETKDIFYSDSNIRYLAKIARDVRNGTANFAEHDLIEESDTCNPSQPRSQRIMYLTKRRISCEKNTILRL